MCDGVEYLPPFSAARVIKQHILPAQYEDVVGDGLINLAVVLQDMATQEHVLASEEFNIPSSQLIIQVNTLSCSWIIITVSSGADQISFGVQHWCLLVFHILLLQLPLPQDVHINFLL